jgi:hypothetical protein
MAIALRSESCIGLFKRLRILTPVSGCVFALIKFSVN